MPVAPPKQEDARAVLLERRQARRVDSSDLGTGMVYCQKERAAEGDYEIAEMPAAELPLTPRPKSDDAVIFAQNVVLAHVAQRGLPRGSGHGLRRFSEPSLNVGLRDAPLLQNKGKNLLRVEVGREIRRAYLFNYPLAPKEDDPERGKELAIVCGEERKAALGAGTASRAAHALQE
jgi:hypothetical protein